MLNKEMTKLIESRERELDRLRKSFKAKADPIKEKLHTLHVLCAKTGHVWETVRINPVVTVEVCKSCRAVSEE